MLWPSLPPAMKGFLGRRGSDRAAERVASLTTRALAVPDFREAEPEIKAELERARRYEHPMAIVMLSSVPDPRNDRPEERDGTGDPDGSIILETRIPHLASLLMATIVTEMLRQSDRVSYIASDDRFVLALPETDRESALLAVRRIHPVLRSRIGVRIRYGAAAFPADGLTLAELLDLAERAWRGAGPRLLEREEEGSREDFDEVEGAGEQAQRDGVPDPHPSGVPGASDGTRGIRMEADQ